jgi:hypothetical protein
MDTLQSKEEWREIEGFSRYKISSEGRVWDTRDERDIPQVVNGGFCCVNIHSDIGVKTLGKVHRLIAIAFLPNPENLHLVAHRDRNKLNNIISNIFWKPKKIVQEKIPVEVKLVDFRGIQYTYSEFATLCKCSVDLLRRRINTQGWTTLECFVGRAEFKGEGYQTDTHWFPDKGEYESAISATKRDQLLSDRQDKLITKAIARAEKKAKIHHGVGVFTNYPIKGIEGRKATRAYYVWQGIIARCYSPLHDSYGRYGGRGTTVDERWHHFQEFAKWYVVQQERGIGNVHVNWHVDKDILFDGNLVYGPDTCCFVPEDVNTFFTKLDAIGYSLHRGAFRVSVTIAGNKYQRGFNTEEDATTWYRRGKTKAAELLLWKYEGLLDSRVTDKLQSA